MNIFVSYTARNNEITKNSLNNFSSKVSSFGRVFVDLLNNNSVDRQARVIKELEKSDLLILLRSQSTYKSEWVQFELSKANEMNIPIIEFRVSEIENLTRDAIGNKISNLVD